MPPTAVPRPLTGTQGTVLMCCGVACLAVNNAYGKSLSADYAPLQILFLRNAIALPFTILITLRMGGRTALFSARPAVHFLRGFLWILATVMLFTSVVELGLAASTALIYIAPLVITAISALFLGERPGRLRWLAVLSGFLGALIIVRPGTMAFQPVSLLAVATAFVNAFLFLSARWVDRRESVWTLLLWMTAASVVLSGSAVVFVWTPVNAGDLWQFAAIALSGTAGITMITQAFRTAPAAAVAPLDYTGLIWATLLGFLIWNEVPDRMTLAGAAIIISGGLVMIWRDTGGTRPGP